MKDHEPPSTDNLQYQGIEWNCWLEIYIASSQKIAPGKVCRLITVCRLFYFVWIFANAANINLSQIKV